MKRLPIKVRVTLWYAALLVAICLLLFALLMAAADYTARAYHQEKLEDAAERILEELAPEDGRLELDDMDDMPNVYATLFEEDGQLIYGYARVQKGAFRVGQMLHRGKFLRFPKIKIL